MTDNQMDEFLEGDFNLLEFFEKRELWRKAQFPERNQRDMFEEINSNPPKQSQKQFKPVN